MAATTTRTQPTTILPLNTRAPHYKWLVASIILLASGTQTFGGGSSINIIMPRLMAAFGADLATTQWIVTGFFLTRVLVTPLLGWLGGLLGYRNMFVAMMAGVVVTSIGCGLATSLTMLVVFRLLQGLIMGTMEGLTAMILVGVFPERQRGLALGLRAIGWSSGEAIFYTVGGYLVEQISWRMIFFLAVPSGIVSALLGLLVLPQQRESRGEPVDYPGLLALAGFLVPLLLAISWSRDSQTETTTLLWLGMTALIGGGLFLLRELLTSFPVVNLHLFQQSSFRLICATAFFNHMGLHGALFMVPIFLQQVLGLSPLQAGLVIVPALLISGATGVMTGRLSDLAPPPLVVIATMLALSIIFYSFSSVTALTAIAVIVGYVILYRICMVGTVTPLTVLTVQELEAEQVRMGQGLMGVVRSIGGLLGVTITSVLFERRRAAYQLFAYQTYDSAALAHGETLRDLQRLLHQAGVMGPAADRAALGAIRRQMDMEAVAVGFQSSFLLSCVCFLLASLPMLYLFLSQRWKR
ncbi:MAG: DHA2 family efflux MFS transporter permease subunit [Candidatus Tectomicrobia bacterium]|nr:DHA2 family efflux MFS transporter permease subunit [Candidatus Tectomicrobia bacterium]